MAAIKAKRTLRLSLAALLLLLLGTLLGGLEAEKATTQDLGGEKRYLTAVSTDKPIYKAGEKVYVRGVLLNAFDRTPLPQAEQSQASIEIKGPKGDTLASGWSQTQESVWAFAWEVPQEQAGGEYTVKVAYPWTGHAPAERKFEIRQYRAPRLKSQIVFLRDGYGPGDQVTATLETTRAEGGAPEGAKVTAVARVDGAEAARVPGSVDAKGLCTVSFALPKEIARGEGSLAFVIEDGGVVETATKTLPILLQTVDIQFYPEGGELVADMLNRVYFEARRPDGKPADMAGDVLEQGGRPDRASFKTVASFRTAHEGRGCFEVTPQKDFNYRIAIRQPAGIKTMYPLPSVKPEGVVLHALKDTYGPAEPVDVEIGCLKFLRVKVTLSKRETLLDSKELDLRTREGAFPPFSKVRFEPPALADGVLTVTVWDEKGTPLAERLVYRQPKEALKVELAAEPKSCVPGGETKLTLKTTRGGKPVSAVVGLTVTDESILELIEKREQAPRLPVMVFLEPEVKELADAYVYLDETNLKAPLAVDLLLGTQGWRRFALMDLPKFLVQHGDAARRVTALRIQAEHEKLRAAELADAKAEGGMFKGGIAVPMAAAPPAPAAQLGAPVDKGIQAPNKPAAELPQRAQEELAAKRPANQPVAAKRLPLGEEAAQIPVEQDRKQLQEAMGKVRAADEKKNMFKDADRAKLEQQDLLLVRVYAHQARPNRKPNDRVDFAETLYWNAGLKTDATTGEATVSFALNDSVTTFQIAADAFDAAGALGAGTRKLESVQPFYVEPKLPLEVTTGDLVRLPLNFVNGIASELPGVKVSAEVVGDGELKLSGLPSFDLGALERARRILDLQVGHGHGEYKLVLNASAGPYADKVTRTLRVKPLGFPIEAAFGGMLDAPHAASHQVTIPKEVVTRSLTAKIAVYPTPLANLTGALQRLIQDPNGCFEQTSSTSYPLTMAQQYFLSHTGVDPKLIEQSKQKLDAGYKKLVSFWCPDRGYEWFGENPGHEALTAFGLLHFHDMRQVREVDSNMLAQTRAWLLKQRDDKGGFERKRRALHTWIEDKDCSNAYILWALLESGEPAASLAKEVAALKETSVQSHNSYVLALAGNALHLAGEKEAAGKLMQRLAEKQGKAGSVEGGTASIVGSGGEALAIETTALAALAWMREPAYAGSVEKSMKFLAESCQSGRYGSTQSTVLALRAIVTYDKLRARPKAAGRVRVFVDGQSVGDWKNFSPETQGAIELPDVSELLPAGAHAIEVKMENGGQMPYSVSVNYHTLVPNASKECKVGLKVALTKEKVAEGETLEANATVTNLSAEAIPTPVAIVGLPGGLEPRHDQLKELVKKGTIDAYEVIGRQVVLYWRGMKAQQSIEVPLSLIAAVPGTYTGPASRAYLYYTDEHKQWVDGLKVEVAAK